MSVPRLRRNREIGRLREWVLIESSTRTADGIGGGTPVWSTFAATWAKVEPTSGSQAWQAEQVSMRVSHKVTIRYQDGITSGMRVNLAGRLLQIHYLRNIEEREMYIEMLCNEGDPS